MKFVKQKCANKKGNQEMGKWAESIEQDKHRWPSLYSIVL